MAISYRDMLVYFLMCSHCSFICLALHSPYRVLFLHFVIICQCWTIFPLLLVLVILAGLWGLVCWSDEEVNKIESMPVLSKIFSWVILHYIFGCQLTSLGGFHATIAFSWRSIKYFSLCLWYCRCKEPDHSKKLWTDETVSAVPLC